MVSMQGGTQLIRPRHEGYRPLAEGAEVRSQGGLLEVEKGGFLQEMGLVKRKRKLFSW